VPIQAAYGRRALAVDPDHHPVGVHGDDLAPGEAPQQIGTIQVIQGARWVTSEQGRSAPAEVDSALNPAAEAIYGACWREDLDP
jgi:hypothetical protein